MIKQTKTKPMWFIPALVLICILIMLITGLVLVPSSSQLAQIISVKVGTLKNWQESGGLQQNLSLGSTGPQVRLLQRMLIEDENNIYPANQLTGKYDTLTKIAVQKFQAEYDLPVSGSVDKQTRDKLNEIFLTTLCPEPEKEYPEVILQKVTKETPLPNGYVPPNLVKITREVRAFGIACLRKDVLPELKAMFDAALTENVKLAVSSAFRSSNIQQYLLDRFTISKNGYAKENALAPAGASEHQLGTTVDLTDSSVAYKGTDLDFENGTGFAWLSTNAYKYGFVMSFPKNKKDITGYEYEPWHWRYVGIPLATYLHDNNLIFDELNFDETNKPIVPGFEQ